MISPTGGAKPRKEKPKPILGPHPIPPDPFALTLNAKDGRTQSNVAHRGLTEKNGQSLVFIDHLRALLVKHHVSPEAALRNQQMREALQRLGVKIPKTGLRRYPVNSSTQKGNLAEIVLAEYAIASSGVMLPIYRLRYNPNVDQSMKGDDVLAFDLDGKPTRIIVGEAKFRAVSTATAVQEIVAGLVRSYKGSVPVSLQFVADRLFEAGDIDLGSRVLDCARQFALGKLRLDYVGMLLSDAQSGTRVDTATPPSLRRLAMISVGVADPDALVQACYKHLE
jgi:hypothetical protein